MGAPQSPPRYSRATWRAREAPAKAPPRSSRKTSRAGKPVARALLAPRPVASTREPTNTARRPNLVGSRGHTWIWVRRAQGRAARAEGEGQCLTGHSQGPGGHSPATSPGGGPPAPVAPSSRPHTRGSTVGDTSHLSASQDPYPRWSSQNVTLEGTLDILFRLLPGDKGKQAQRGKGLAQGHTAWPPDPGGLHVELDNSWSVPPVGKGLESPGHLHGAPSLVSPLLWTGLHLPFSSHHSAARLAPGPLPPQIGRAHV